MEIIQVVLVVVSEYGNLPLCGGGEGNGLKCVAFYVCEQRSSKQVSPRLASSIGSSSS